MADTRERKRSGRGSRISDLGSRISDFGCRISDFGFRKQAIASKVQMCIREYLFATDPEIVMLGLELLKQVDNIEDFKQELLAVIQWSLNDKCLNEAIGIYAQHFGKISTQDMNKPNPYSH